MVPGIAKKLIGSHMDQAGGDLGVVWKKTGHSGLYQNADVFVPNDIQRLNPSLQVANDQSGNRYHGRHCTGGSLLGNVIFLDGSTDFVYVADPLPAEINGVTAMSAGGWVFYRGGDYKTIISRNAGSGKKSWTFYIESSSRLRFRYSTDGSSDSYTSRSVETPPLLEWCHLAFTFTPSTSIKFYLNGEMIMADTSSIPASFFAAASALYIGYGYGMYGNCSYSDMFWTDSALSDAEILDMYQHGKYPSGLTALWPFDDRDTSADCKDVSGNGNDMARWSSAPTTTGRQRHGDCRYVAYFNSSTSCSVAAHADINDLWAAGGSIAFWWRMGQNHTGGTINDKSNGSSDGWRLVCGGATNAYLELYIYTSGTAWIWRTDSIFTDGPDYHIIVTYSTAALGTAPVIYVNGVSVTVNETQTGSGTYATDASNNLLYGDNVAADTKYKGYLWDWGSQKSVISAADALLAGTLGKYPDFLTFYSFAQPYNNGIVNTGSGTAATMTSGTHTQAWGKFLTDVVFNSGKGIKRGRQYDGASRYESIGHETEFDVGTGDFFLWMFFKNGNASGSTVVLFTSHDGSSDAYWELRTDTSNQLQFRLHDGTTTKTATSSSSVADDAWHSAVAVREDTDIHLYLDGALQETTDLGLLTGSLTNSHPLSVGARVTANGVPSTFYQGVISEYNFKNGSLAGHAAKAKAIHRILTEGF